MITDAVIGSELLVRVIVGETPADRPRDPAVFIGAVDDAQVSECLFDPSGLIGVFSGRIHMPAVFGHEIGSQRFGNA